ncbi:hypothetical protein M885DRAFT_17017 [Pelagophyceae sp. CCMP2097]|nr:hypothetical protein M885DRAFT_17017 [Pelagophyceae sp. CCMP2097]
MAPPRDGPSKWRLLKALSGPSRRPLSTAIRHGALRRPLETVPRESSSLRPLETAIRNSPAPRDGPSRQETFVTGNVCRRKRLSQETFVIRILSQKRFTGTLVTGLCRSDRATQYPCRGDRVTGSVSPGCRRGTLSRAFAAWIRHGGPCHGGLVTGIVPQKRRHRDLVGDLSHRDLATGLCRGTLPRASPWNLSTGLRHLDLVTWAVPWAVPRRVFCDGFFDGGPYTVPWTVPRLPSTAASMRRPLSGPSESRLDGPSIKPYGTPFRGTKGPRKGPDARL